MNPSSIPIRKKVILTALVCFLILLAGIAVQFQQSRSQASRKYPGITPNLHSHSKMYHFTHQKPELSPAVDELRRWDIFFFKAVNQHAGSGWDYVLGWVTHLGEPYVFLPLTVLFILIWDRPEKRWRRILTVVLIAACAGITSSVIKEQINRPRPYVYFHKNEAATVSSTNYLYGILKSGGFPSGHTTGMFALAFVLARLYGKRAAFVYGLASWIAISRIYVGAHFPSDIIAGTLLGTFVPFTFFLFLEFPQRISKIISLRS